ncbi:hypothetical protein BJX64DRAFT_301165 [Aspergillus heterothallicus]
MAVGQSLIQTAFQAAMSEFRADLKNDSVYNEILAVRSIDEVYDLTRNLQAKQDKKGHLRQLARIEPYLNRLREYSAVIEVFMQVQPEIIALIWGPIKLLQWWSSVLTQSFDAIANAFADIGNTRLYEVMVLFFKDILDFYLVGLRFFAMPRWKYFFEPLWPRKIEQIRLVATHIERHTLLMRNEVRLEHIREEHQARLKAFEHFKNVERAHRLQKYQAFKTDMHPPSYDDKLSWCRARVCKGTGKWLLQDSVFKNWLDHTSQTTRVIWIQGIPGAGKTFLAAIAVYQARVIGRTGFAFLTHDLRNSTSALNVLQSRIFQVVGHREDLQDTVCHYLREEIKNDLEAAAALLTGILKCVALAYLIIDGLDEIEPTDRGQLVEKLLKVVEDCSGTRILFSSRDESDVRARLESPSNIICVERRNEDSIRTFVNARLTQTFNERSFDTNIRDEITQSLSGLVCRARDDASEISAELSVLPNNLNDAYARVLARIDNLQSTSARDKARKILGWLGCSSLLLTVQEVQAALAIEPDNAEPPRRIPTALDLNRLCGPIVEIRNGYLWFVHFTVKE